MKTIIPVAGVGSRLRPHTLSLPKVLLNVGGKPILSHIIDKALESGIDEFAFIIGYRGNQIKEFIESNYTFKHDFYEQEEMLGLAYAVGLAKEYLVDEPVLIILGDTVFDVDLKPVFDGQHSSLGVQSVNDPRRFGTAELDGTGFVKSLVEKDPNPKSNLALVGLYYLKNGSFLRTAIDDLIGKNHTLNGEYQITDALHAMVNKGQTFTTFSVDGWYDCGKPDTMLSTNKFLLSRLEQNYSIEGSLVCPPVYIDKSAQLENSIVGPNTTIANDAQIKNSILINSIVGEGASVKNVSLTDSIVGSHAAISGSLNILNISDFSEITV
jgi:glucose-1-phosphate thymidylyltransferase